MTGPIERRLPMIKGFGCQMPAEKIPLARVRYLLERDLHAAQQAGGPFFSRKSGLIEECLNAHMMKEPHPNDTMQVGYAPGHKYIYPGLPMEIAIAVDKAIVEVIDLIARCKYVAMTGSCCAGHPSARISGPDWSSQAYSQNHSPQLNIMFYKNEVSENIAESLCRIGTDTRLDGKASIRIAMSINRNVNVEYSGVLVLLLVGIPRLHCSEVPGYSETVSLYQHALKDFWDAVARVFGMVTGDRIEPERFEFACKKNIDRQWEQDLIERRRLNGNTLPNYVYFNGTRQLETPVIYGKKCA